MKITITIPKPCTENWYKMNPSEKGMFCSNCKKEVVNYQNYSKDQLIKSLNNSNEEICGRFSNHQINKVLISNENNRFQRFGLLTVFSSIFLTTPLFSQNTKPKIEVTENKLNGELKKKTTNDFVEFYGTVVENFDNNDVKYPIPGVNVTQKGEKNTVQSNFDGTFKIKIPTDDFKNNVVLIFDFIGMDSKEMEIFKTQNNLKVEMISSDLILGEVVITKTKKKNIFKRMGILFK